MRIDEPTIVDFTLMNHTHQTVAQGGVLSGAGGYVPYTGATTDVTLGTHTIQSPTVIGGTAVGSSLSLQSTTGVGTTDFIKFNVGNNGATESMRILDSGIVLIGTTTANLFPIATNFPALEVESLISGTQAVIRVGASIGANSASVAIAGNRAIDLQNFASIRAVNSASGAEANVANINFTKDGTAADTKTSITFGIDGGAGAANRVIFKGTGEVGIGTNTPLDMLHIFKTSVFIAITEVSSDTVGSGPSIDFRRKRTTGGVTTTDDFIGGIVGKGVLTDGVTYAQATSITFFQDAVSTATVAPGRILFNTAGTVTTGERMRITSAGNVGVGTTNPLGRFTVQADTSGTGINFNGRNNAGIDEVFMQFFKFDGTTLHGSIEGISGRLDIRAGAGTVVISVANAGTTFTGTISGASSITTTGIMVSTTATVKADAGGTALNINGRNNVAGESFIQFFKLDGTTAQGYIEGISSRIDFLDAGFNLVMSMTTKNLFVGGGTVPTARLHISAGTATASTAPLKFNSGTLLTTAEAGAVEFLTDAYYGTITTGAARKTFAFLENPTFTTGITTPVITVSTIAIDADVTARTGPIVQASVVQGAASANEVYIATGTHAFGVENYVLKTRSVGSTNANTIVVNNDELFGLYVLGADGADYKQAATIVVKVDGTPGVGDMPGRIELATSLDGAAAPVERLRISNDGKVGIGVASSTLARLAVVDATVAQAIFQGYAAQSGTPASGFNGQIVLGSTATSQGSIGYDGITVGALYIDNTFDNVAGDIYLRTRTAGTPIQAITIRGSGNVGLQVATPTAILHIKAGTATANTAPIKLTAGTLLATPEIGALEFTDDGTTAHFYVTVRIATVVTRVQVA